MTNIENFNIVANQSREFSGIYYNVSTSLNKKYTFIICGYLKTGSKAFVHCENNKGVKLIERKYFFETGDDQIFKFDIDGNGSEIKFGALFCDKNIRNVLKIYYIVVMDENNNVLNNIIKLENRPKIFYYENMNYVYIYKKLIELKKTKYIAIDYKDGNGEKETLNMFNDDHGKILIKLDCVKGYYDDIDNFFILPQNSFKKYLLSISENIYYFKY